MTTFTQQEIEFLQKHGNEVSMATGCPVTVVKVEVSFPAALSLCENLHIIVIHHASISAVYKQDCKRQLGTREENKEKYFKF